MRAIVVDRLMEPEELSISELDPPEPGSDEILIDVKAAGCNFSDLLMLKGEYQLKPDLPFIPGGEVAGIVRELGTHVKGFAVGDRVLSRCSLGGYAERVAAPAVTTFELPESLSFAAGTAMVTVYPTSYAALLWRASLQPGETLLVHAAAGGVGLAAVQIGKALGATVIATAGGREKLEIAASAGADILIDYRREDFVPRVLEVTEGRGADVIYDSVGGDTTDRSLRCIHWNGRLLVIGFASGKIPSLELNRVLLKNISVVGLHWSAYPDREPERIRECVAGLFEMARVGTIDPLVRTCYPLAEAGAALMALSTRQTVGKVVLVPSLER